MPSRGSGDATAVARTTVSPVLTSAAPEACLAMRPVSKTNRLPPASSTATSCFVDIESSFRFVRLGCLCGDGAACAHGTRVRKAGRPMQGAGSGLVRCSVKDGDRDHCPVWVLPVQRELSDY